MAHRIKWLLYLLLLPLLAINASAQPDSLNYIGKVNHGRFRHDTTPHMYIFGRFNWHLSVTNPKIPPKNYTTISPDTFIFHTGDTVHMSAFLRVDTGLLNKIISVKYNVSGSMRFSVNGQPIVKTGIYCNKIHDKCSGFSIVSYTTTILKDTLTQLTVDYVPMHLKKTFEAGIEIGTNDWAEHSQYEEIGNQHWDYAIGLYYLAFGLVFMFIFFFYKDKSENLYFALFCIFASFSKLTAVAQLSYLLSDASKFIFILALEFLSFFLAKVLRNKDRKKTPLIIVIALSVIALISGNWNNLSYVLMGGGQLNILEMLIILSLYAYSIGTSLVYLFYGFGQKRWEAKAILFTCLVGILLNVVIPAVLATIFATQSQYNNFYFVSISARAGLFLYPLSATIVLGRRTGLAQKQLLSQIESIERLSNENLQKEQEKKQILEDLNVSLEQKVKERTEEVLQQKELIEVKNKELTENVTYAKRIQSAILPDLKEIQNKLVDSFVIYLPKDIVSGDFYFYAEKQNKAIIIAGDCTGHGVSGALMSMVGSSALNQLINEKGLTRPNEILKELSAAVIDTLNQDENESSDGMDIALCAFDLENRTLEFAGANRPLWLIRNGEFTAIKPDKFPIGGLQMEQDRTFTLHSLDLQTGDSIYIFSDGYADQFGGPAGKKMLSSKFKDKLLTLQTTSMAGQGAVLRSHFDEWKGNHEQVDDVLVIGIRV